MKPVNKTKEVIFITMDWKEELSKEEKKIINNHVKLTKGYWEELNIHTGDDKVYAAGPHSFFKWLSSQNNYCAMELFTDIEIITNGDTMEDIEVVNWYMKGTNLMVRVENLTTNEQKDYTYEQWVKVISEMNVY